MKQRQPGDRLRVVIAGNIYAKRALVRRFLEDDGFDVVGEALTAEQLLGMGDLGRADAVVVDGDLLGDSIDPLRALAPDSAIVVFANRGGAGEFAPGGADGYLEKGVGLASLTALLHSLLSEAPPLPLGLAWTAPVSPPQTERRVLAGLAGVAASIVLVAVVALAVFGGVEPSSTPGPPELPTPGAGGSPSASGPDARDLAMTDLSDLRDALEAGHPLAASWIIDTLQRDLLAAQQAGFSISGIGASAAQMLRPFLGDLAPDLLADLRSLFGSVFDLPTSTTGSDGTGTAPTGGTASGSTSGTTSGGTSGGTATGGETTGGSGGDGGGGGTGGDGGSGSGGGGGGGDGGTSGRRDSHGNGNHYGWTNKPPEGGWHGTKPHPHGNSHGHGKKDR